MARGRRDAVRLFAILLSGLTRHETGPPKRMRALAGSACSTLNRRSLNIRDFPGFVSLKMKRWSGLMRLAEVARENQVWMSASGWLQSSLPNAAGATATDAGPLSPVRGMSVASLCARRQISEDDASDRALSPTGSLEHDS
jgi:hypothetical protein